MNKRLDDQAHDWLIEWVATTDQAAEAHYRHIQEGDGESCGCPYEGGKVR